MKNIFLYLIFALNTFLNAQNLQIKKGIQFLSERKYEKVIKLVDKNQKKDKKTVEWYFLKGAAELEMSEIPEFNSKENYFSRASKSFKKGVEKDESEILKLKYKPYLNRLILKSNTDALISYSAGRYSKAILLYRDNYELTGDTIARTMQGLSYYKNGAEYDGVEILTKTTNWMYKAFLDSAPTKQFLWEPYAILSQYYLDRNEIDSARRFSEIGLEMFPKQPTLSKLTKNLLKNDLRASAYQGITQSFIEIVSKGLSFFPNDSFFLTNQNAYYLNKLSNYSEANNIGKSDTLYTEFFDAKSYTLKQGANNKVDPFLVLDPILFLTNCLDYGLKTNSPSLMVYFFKKWFCLNNKIPNLDEKLTQRILLKPDLNVSRRLISNMYLDARKNYPKNVSIKNSQLLFFNSWMLETNNKSIIRDKAQMCDRLIADFGKTPTLVNNKVNLIQQIIQTETQVGNMEEAWIFLNELETFTNKEATDLRKIVMETDFQVRFVGTAINYNTINNKKIANTGWTGNSSKCSIGYIPDTTVRKVLARINYFRQNAGVPPMLLIADRMLKSQAAAVMYAGKGVFTRTPELATHPCMSIQGEEAAKYIQGILESNPVQSVTSLMNDKNSDNLGNRQILLNIGNSYGGFGVAEDNSVFWLLDTIKDLNLEFTKNYHSWPPKGVVEKMLLFKTWHFSLNKDLKNAQVSVTINGKNIPVNEVNSIKLQTLACQTLAYSPQIDLKTLKEGDVISITITTADKKVFKYQSKVFEYKK